MAGDMLLNSLKVGKGGVHIEYVTLTGEKRRRAAKPRGAAKLKLEPSAPPPAAPSQVEIHHALSCPDPGHPDFTAALQSFVEPMIDLLELPTRYGETLTVTAVHFSEQKGGKRGLVVTGTKTLEKSGGRPFNVTTPLIVEREAGSDGAAEQVALWEAADRVLAEAIAYIGGKRAQAELFDEALQAAEATVGAAGV